MIDLPLRKLRPGMVISQSVYNSSGASYLTKGMTLTQNYIDKLRQTGIEGIHVVSTSSNIQLKPPEDVLEEKTRVVAVKRVHDVFEAICNSGTFDIAPLEKASVGILQNIMDRRQNLVQLTDIRTHDMYTFAHSVNVSMLSSLLGVLYGLDKAKLSELTLSALLHDVGKVVIPKEILNKPGRLTNEEFDLIKTHPKAGSEQIMKMPIHNRDVLSIVARQHHEHMDGTGYPDGRKGKNIHIYGRIGAIADVYDALTSSRPYKKAYTPAIAYNIMTNLSKGQFDEELIRLFFRNVAIYPVGTVLKTSAGHAIVRSIEFGKTERPLVCVFADNNGKVLKNPVDIDLSQENEVSIINVIKDNELYHLIHTMNFDPAILLLESENKAAALN